jgi:hypothetical protein
MKPYIDSIILPILGGVTFMTILIGTFLFFAHLADIQNMTRQVENKLHYSKGLEEGIKMYQIEAVKNDKGYWMVEQDGTSVFMWKTE